jgi:hypothetical protein
MEKCYIQITSLQEGRQIVGKINKNSTNMVHNGALNVGTHVIDYFLNYKSIV